MSTAPLAPAPELIVDAGGRPKLRTALRELWAFRRTALAFAERDLRVKYKQTALGVAWAVLQPVTLMALFTVTLGNFADVSGGGVPYAAFALSAFVAWIFVQTAVTFSANSLITDTPIIRKVYFPRELPVLGAVLAALVDLGIGLLVFAVVGPVLGAHVSPTWLLVPVLVIPLIALAVGVGLLLAGFTAYYRDFRYTLPLILQLWLFATPVAYPLTIVPESIRSPYLLLNPAAGLFDSLRRVMTLGELPDPEALSLSLVGVAATLGLGYLIFKRLEPNFADVL